MADNADDKRDGAPIAKNGQSRYDTTLPQLDILISLQTAGIDAKDSDSAGGFVCNHDFYLLEKRINEHDQKLKGGLVHLPMLPEQVLDKPGHPSMSLQKEVEALKIVIETAVKESPPVVKQEQDMLAAVLSLE